MIDRKANAASPRKRWQRARNAGDIHPRRWSGPAAVNADRWSRSPGAVAEAAHLILDRGDLGADGRRRRQGVRRAEAAAHGRDSRFSTSRTTRSRSPSLPTNARCSATAVTSPAIRPAQTDNEVVELMIGPQAHSHVFPPGRMPQRIGAKPVLEAQKPVLGRAAGRYIARPQARRGGRPWRARRAKAAQLLLAFFGVLRGLSGEIISTASRCASPTDTARRDGIGMALIPEDRKTEGHAADDGAREPVASPRWTNFRRGGIVDPRRRAEADRRHGASLAIRRRARHSVSALSGGNQQKVVITKWLMRRPRVILLNDPTRGIDVGTKRRSYQLLRKLADAGA